MRMSFQVFFIVLVEILNKKVTAPCHILCGTYFQLIGEHEPDHMTCIDQSHQKLVCTKFQMCLQRRDIYSNRLHKQIQLYKLLHYFYFKILGIIMIQFYSFPSQCCLNFQVGTTSICDPVCVCVCLSVCGRNNFKNKMASGGDGHLYTIHTNIDKYTQ